MSSTKINDGKTLGDFIGNIIKESVKSALHNKTLQEKEKQDSTGGSDDSVDQLFGSGDGDSEGDSGGDEEQKSSKTMDDDTEAMAGGDVEVKDIVEKLNSIRSGKSFKDDAVKNSMDEYINSLSSAERVALLAFLKGIAQIVTGEIPAQQAMDPQEKPADVQMKKGETKQTKHVKPNVIKVASQPEKSKSSQEDTSSPAPIKPVKR